MCESRELVESAEDFRRSGETLLRQNQSGELRVHSKLSWCVHTLFILLLQPSHRTGRFAPSTQRLSLLTQLKTATTLAPLSATYLLLLNLRLLVSNPAHLPYRQILPLPSELFTQLRKLLQPTLLATHSVHLPTLAQHRKS